MNGILTLNKPAGWTSRDAVNRVQRLVRPAKAGHAGTLDPLAAGVLVVAIGQATRLIAYVQQMEKEYRAVFLLGRRSPSDDVETEVEELAAAPTPSLAQVEAALPQFTGAILQRPPAYSALKVEGRRAYKLARRGEPPELAPRPVEIHLLTVAHYDYPRLELHVRCTSGTYIRALGRDLAESLGTAAVMTELMRTAVGDFRIEDAVDADQLDDAVIAERLAPPAAAVARLPHVILTDDQVEKLGQGQLISIAHWQAPAVSAVDSRGRLVAILKPAHDDLWKPSPNFSQSS